MDYEEKYKEALERARNLHKDAIDMDDNIRAKQCEIIFPELKENEDDNIRKALIDYFDDANKADENPLQIYGIYTDKAIAWLEKQGENANFYNKIQVGNKVTRNKDGVLVNLSQLKRVAIPIEKQGEPIDKEKVLIGARKDVALSIMNFLDRNTLGMCLSNMECKDLEDAVVDSDWSKVYNYMKKKLEKQGEPYGKRKECSDCQFNYAGECKGSCAMKRDEQKPTDKVEPKDYSSIDPHFFKTTNNVKPKFKAGDWVIFNGLTLYVKKVVKGFYRTITIDGIPNSYDGEIDNVARLWTIQDAKDGDVIYSRHNTESFEWIGIFKSLDKENKRVFFYGFWHNMAKTFSVCRNEPFVLYCDFSPATKDQRDTLEKAIADAGYIFDFEKKELKKVEDEEYNGEDYGIDGLWHAQRILEKTLGSVDGYQSDDGILEHKCAITAVKKLYRKNRTLHA